MKHDTCIQILGKPNSLYQDICRQCQCASMFSWWVIVHEYTQKIHTLYQQPNTTMVIKHMIVQKFRARTFELHMKFSKSIFNNIQSDVQSKDNVIPGECCAARSRGMKFMILMVEWGARLFCSGVLKRCRSENNLFYLTSTEWWVLWSKSHKSLIQMKFNINMHQKQWNHN